MSVNLVKGQKVELRKENGGSLTKVMVGLGWDEAQPERKGGFLSSLFAAEPDAIDCDASAFLCQNGRIVNKTDIVYFGNLTHKSECVRHMGDNLTGAGDGDDEQIMVDLSKIPANIERIAFTVTIYDAELRRQNFGQVSNAYIRIVDMVTGQEIIHYDLGEDFSIETAIVVGEIYKRDGNWKFNAIGSGFQGGLAALCGHYGIEVA